VVRPLLSLPGVKDRLASGFSVGEMWFNVGEDRLLAEALAEAAYRLAPTNAAMAG
jgi:hypothetical protein